MSAPGLPYWVDRNRTTRRPTYPVYRAESAVDVAIVGGGLTGAVAAYVLAAGGLDVVLVEADRLAGGLTATGLGVIQPDPAAAFAAVASALGTRRTRMAWTETRRSALDFGAAIRRLRSRADLSPTDLLLSAREAGTGSRLQREHLVRRQAGLSAPWLSGRAAEGRLGTSSEGAIRLREVFLHDPVRTTLAFSRAAVAKGARLFERSPVRRTRFDRRGAEVVLANGTIRARGVLVATGAPGVLFQPLRRHVSEWDRWIVVTDPFTAAMRREAGSRQQVQAESGADPCWLRWLPDHRAMFAGALSPAVPPRQRDRLLVPRAGHLMYELSRRYPIMSGLPARWAWRAPFTSTADGLPWIGAHRNYPFHFFVFAPGPLGDAMAWFAARAALRHFTDRSRREDAVFAHRG